MATRLVPSWLLLGAALLLSPDLRRPGDLARAEEETAENEGKEKEAKAKEEAKAGPAAALREGRYDEAIEGFRKAAAGEGTEAVAARKGLSEALSAEGKDAEAVAALREAKDLDRSPVLLAALGRVHLRRGRLAEAEKAFRAALGDPGDPGRGPEPPRGDPLEAGPAGGGQGLLGEARRRLRGHERGGCREARRPGLRRRWASPSWGLNRFREANEIMFSQAKDMDPKDPALLLESGRVLLREVQLARLARRAPRGARPEPALRRSPRDPRGQLPRRLPGGHEPLRPRREEPQEGPRGQSQPRRGVHGEGGALALRRKDRGGGEGLWKAIELDPSSLRARGYLASCYLLDADDAKVRSAEKEALAINPSGAEFFHTIALAIENKFRYQDAVRFCDRALELDPDYWPAFVTLGINCLRTGEEERGRKFLDGPGRTTSTTCGSSTRGLLLRHMDAKYQELRTDRFVFKFPKDDFELLKNDPRAAPRGGSRQAVRSLQDGASPSRSTSRLSRRTSGSPRAPSASRGSRRRELASGTSSRSRPRAPYPRTGGRWRGTSSRTWPRSR